MTALDVVFGLRQIGQTLYGFGVGNSKWKREREREHPLFLLLVVGEGKRKKGNERQARHTIEMSIEHWTWKMEEMREWDGEKKNEHEKQNVYWLTPKKENQQRGTPSPSTLLYLMQRDRQPAYHVQ